MEPLFYRLEVIDESAFWESSDDALLREMFDGFQEALAGAIAEHPNARVKVRLQNERIADVIA